MTKIVTLGELLMRYSTPFGQTLDTCQQFHAHYGGSEANVSVALASLDHQAIMLSKVPDNPIGKGAVQHLNRYGVDTRHVHVGGKRLGIYYLETGAGIRSSSVVYDRDHSSFATISLDEWEVEHLFDHETILHVSGITLALSTGLVAETLRLIKIAKAKGAKLSFDSNYRSKLWTIQQASEVIKQIMPYVDYCSMGELDALHLLDIPNTNERADALRMDYFYTQMQKLYPNITVFYSTRRQVTSANENILQGTYWSDGKISLSKSYGLPYIVDRVGGGDAFAAGILHGLIRKHTAEAIVEFATALSALKHTIAGDVIGYSEKQVDVFMSASSSKIDR